MAYMCLHQREDSIPSAPVSNYGIPAAYEDDDLLPFASIIAQSERVKSLTLPTVIDLTRNDTDDDAEGQSIPSSPTRFFQPLPTSSQSPTHSTSQSPSSRPGAASSGVKRFPWKNIPPWARYPKQRPALNSPPSKPPSNALCAAADITAIAHSASPEIADSDDGHTDDDGADKCPRPSAFDVFAEDGQPPAKRQCRASSAASSVRSGETWTLPVIESPHDNGLYADLNREEEMWSDHEWQAQRIVGERQTPSGLEYEVIVQKTLWLPRAALNTKLVRRYRREQRAATRVRTRWSSRLQTAVSSARQCR